MPICFIYILIHKLEKANFELTIDIFIDKNQAYITEKLIVTYFSEISVCITG